MGNMQHFNMDQLLSPKDFEAIKECSQVSYSNIHFFSDSIWTFSGKQEIKAVLSEIFRASSSQKANTNSKDNWYTYFDGGKSVKLACLFDEMERNNAVINTMNYIKRKTGFNVPYTLVRFDLDLVVKDEPPRHVQIDDNSSAYFAVRALKLTEKYMHLLGMQAAMLVDKAIRQLNMPAKKSPAVVSALITDEQSEQWFYYMFICSADFDLDDWVPPEEYKV